MDEADRRAVRVAGEKAAHRLRAAGQAREGEVVVAASTEAR